MLCRYVERSLRTLTILAVLFASLVVNAAVINEIRIDQPGADTDEYVELHGIAGESLDNLSYLVIGDQGSNQGYIEAVVNLNGYQVAADGFFLIAESSFSLSPNVDLITTLNFENNDNVTHMLVSNFTGQLHDDIDGNDDGLIDNSLWGNVIDSIALLDNPVGGDIIYSANTIGPQAGHSPAHVYRDIDQVGAWQPGKPEIGVDDSPRMARTNGPVTSVPEPDTLALLLPGMVILLRCQRAFATKPSRACRRLDKVFKTTKQMDAGWFEVTAQNA